MNRQQGTNLNDLTTAQQGEVLTIAGRLLSLWSMSGKTVPPSGFSSLRNFAIAVALESYDMHALSSSF